jgi:hypothetical protein
MLKMSIYLLDVENEHLWYLMHTYEPIRNHKIWRSIREERRKRNVDVKSMQIGVAQEVKSF